MRLATEFVQLPLRFDAGRLAAEAAAVPEAAWRPHPQGFAGNSALPLIAAGGDPANDQTKGPMLATPHLALLPYLQQALAELRAPIGRTRLMRLDGNAEATAHADVNYYWAERLRVHVPVVTTPGVAFRCGERTVHMAAGECWVFDTWRVHNVTNPEPTRRIHLVADTVGSPELWRLIEEGAWPFAEPPRRGAPARFVPWRAEVDGELALEKTNQPVVMSPWEQARLLEIVLGDLEGVADGAEREKDQVGRKAELRRAASALQRRWRALWAVHGEGAGGWDEYRAALEEFERRVAESGGGMRLPNGLEAAEVFRHLVVRPALNPELAGAAGSPAMGAPAPSRQPAPSEPLAVPRPSAMAGTPHVTPPPAAAPRSPADHGAVRRGRSDAPRRFARPIFIVSPPRSGSSLLFETLALSPSVWTVGGESHALVEGVRELHPRARGWESNRLGAVDARPEIVERLTDAFFLGLRDREGRRPAAGAEDLRLLEKTPKNALRVPFLAAAFPDAVFVYLYRNPRETINSIYEAWGSGRFVTYSRLPGWTGLPWSLLLVPGWRDLAGRPLPEIAARQWEAATRILLDDLEALPAARWCVANYGRLIVDPQAEVARLCGFLGIAWDRSVAAPLPPSRHTLTPPEPGKWRRNAALLEPVLPLAAATAERALEVFARRPEHLPLPEPADMEAPAIDGPLARGADALPAAPPPGSLAIGTPASPPAAAPRPSFRSVSTKSFPVLLEQLGCSLLVSTYQTGRVVVVRADGGALNTHFRAFPAPMGIAVGRRGLAIGTQRAVWRYQNQPEAGRKLEPAGKHDACFLPRAAHVTGDIRVHELAWAGDELWIVNTRFSCLCVLDADHSFVPRWRPPFVSALAADDRCHLNGLAVVDGAVRYATALGATDSAAGWRAGKAAGGVLLDVPGGEAVAGGLSMPHSPRWHGGRLWVLESGKGEVGVVDTPSGRVTTVARFPGFTRGLAFAGPYAFVGLSQVRESVFGGIPLADRLRDRVCGVWALDTRSGEVVAFLRFEDAVQEIFEVAALPGVRFPELVEPEAELSGTAFVLPPAALAELGTPAAARQG